MKSRNTSLHLKSNSDVSYINIQNIILNYRTKLWIVETADIVKKMLGTIKLLVDCNNLIEKCIYEICCQHNSKMMYLLCQ